MAVIVSDAFVWELVSTLNAAVRQRVVTDGWRLSDRTWEDLARLNARLEELRQQVPNPSSERFRNQTMTSVSTRDVTVSEYADEHGVTESYTRRLCRDGNLDAWRIDGKSWRIRVSA